MKKLLASIFGSSVLWGSALAVVFYGLIRQGVIQNELIIRYAAGHPVEFITVFLFFIGMASLFFKYLRLLRGRRAMCLGPIFAPIKPEKEDLTHIDDYLDAIQKAEEFRGPSLQTNRLRRALLFLKSSGRSDELDQELRCLADEDAMAVDSDYGMVKMFIWAIPILGFLGTVIGITMALGNLNLTELETTGKLLANGLKVAFDTTALALSLVFFLYFTLFFVQRVENKLFTRVDELVNRDLKGRFIPVSSPREAEEFGAARRVLQTILDAFDAMMNHQTQVWTKAMTEMGTQGTKMIQSGGEQIERSLRSAFQETAAQHTRIMVQSEEKLMTEILAPYAQVTKDCLEKLNELSDRITAEGTIFCEILRNQQTLKRRNVSRHVSSETLSETAETTSAAVESPLETTVSARAESRSETFPQEYAPNLTASRSELSEDDAEEGIFPQSASETIRPNVSYLQERSPEEMKSITETIDRLRRNRRRPLSSFTENGEAEETISRPENANRQTPSDFNETPSTRTAVPVSEANDYDYYELSIPQTTASSGSRSEGDRPQSAAPRQIRLTSVKDGHSLSDQDAKYMDRILSLREGKSKD